jgi:hypothetical protein
MDSTGTPHKLTQTAAWLVGTAVVLACYLAAPAVAWADQSCDDAGDETLASVAEAMFASASHKAGLVSPVPDTAPATPCTLSQYDSPSYNVCYAANPRPISTMPKWLAELQAEDVVGGVLARVDQFTDDQDPAQRSLRSALSASMLAELIDFYERNEMGGEPLPMCVEGLDIDSCEAIPPAAVLVFSNATIPLVRPAELHEPPTLLDDHSAQPPLVELRVGPAVEHRTPPDRPPPV